MKCGPAKSSTLALIRLETHFSSGNKLRALSSFPSWIEAASRQVDSLHLVVPVTPDAAEQAQGTSFEPRPSDYIYRLPDCRGYLRAYRALPSVLWQLARLRRRVDTILVRIPEHLNLVLLPLLWALRFRIVAWVVADRTEVRVEERNRRGNSLLMRCAFAFASLTERMEGFFLRRLVIRVVVNGSALVSKIERLGVTQDRLLCIVSSNLRAGDMPSVRSGRSSSKRHTVLYVGRLSPEKRIGDLLAAVATIKREYLEKGRECPLVKVVGWAAHGELDRLSEEAIRLDIEKEVEFCGPVPFGPKLFALYESASVFVLPSWSEGTPRVLVEAMAFGLPIVATAVGGVPDLVEDGQNGYLVQPRQPDMLARKIMMLLEDEGTRAQMGSINAVKAQELSVEKVCSRLIAFALFK